MFKLLICGDRNWTDKAYIKRALENIQGVKGYGLLTTGKKVDILIINGGCRGADVLAMECAIEMGIPVQTVQAEWEKHGKRAGPIRNIKMLDLEPNVVWAFHDHLEKSKGTAHTLAEAKRRGIPTEVFIHARKEMR